LSANKPVLLGNSVSAPAPSTGGDNDSSAQVHIFTKLPLLKTGSFMHIL
jgi:hypothetical protein